MRAILSAVAVLAACSGGAVPPTRFSVTARGETAAAVDPDDVAIWIDPKDPARSLLVTSDKELGLRVYDLDGGLVQEILDGPMNGVDLRGELVAASRLGDDTVALYRIDPARRRLQPLAAWPAGHSVYGICMYTSARDGAHHVFVDSKQGHVTQWRLRDGGRAGDLVRSFDAGGQVEGCVADDQLGRLYLGEETVGIWRYGAEPEAGDARQLVAPVDGVQLSADVEGLALYRGERGFLLASSQGDDMVSVYRRDDNAFVAKFAVAEGAIDGASHSDGLEVTHLPLGPRFPEGLLVVHDGSDGAGASAGNFKLVSWADVARRL